MGKVIDFIGRITEEDLHRADPEMIAMIESSALVRCRDCAYHGKQGDIPYCSRLDYGYGWGDDDFCSYGEARL